MTAPSLIARLRADPRREVYACQGGGYWMTYQGGEVSWPEIGEAMNAGLLREKYPGQNLACWVLNESVAA
jgi:hypothetical protein